MALNVPRVATNKDAWIRQAADAINNLINNPVAGGGGGGTITLSGDATGSGTSTIAVTIASASGSTKGLMSAADYTKLAGIAAGATVNSADSYLLSRTNHTGTQAASTITGTALTSANNLSDLGSAATARTNLGATTIGGNLFTLANPSAVTFPRYNADNTVSALSASAFRSAISAASAGPSIQAVTSSATVTPTFSDDQVNITAQAVGLTLANPTGTAVDGWGMAIRIKDNGTARTIAYGTQYRAIGVTLPTTTVVSKTLYLGCIWNAADTKFDVVAVAQEA